MAFDREDALKKAEKLLRLGRLDAAIVEYQRIVDEVPNDWKTLNALGDLYLRANQTPRAVSLFERIAQHLAAEGFDARAQAFYKRILKVAPDNQRALEALADLAIRQGILVEARGHLVALSQARQAQGDARGAAEALLRVNTLDPTDFSSRREAARTAAQSGNTDLAARELVAIAADFAADQKHAEAIDVLQEAIAILPDDEALKERVIENAISARLFDPLRASLKNGADCLTLSDRLLGVGWPEGASLALDEAVRLSPDSSEGRTRAARLRYEQGDYAGAWDHLSAIGQIEDPEVQRLAFVSALRTGRGDDAVERLRRLLDHEQVNEEDAGALIAANRPLDAALWAPVELLVDRLAQRRNLATAVAQLRGFLDGCPSHVPALTKRVELLVDEGSEHELIDAQAQLAEAYLQAGSGAEARIIAEDLVSRSPGDDSRRDLLRRALVLVGEPDPENAVTAFAGQIAALSTSLDDDGFTEQPPKPVESVASPVWEAPAAQAVKKADVEARGLFELGPGAIDLSSILGESEPSAPSERGNLDAEAPEIDLTEVLRELKPPPANVTGAKKGLKMPDQPERSNLDEVFRDFRDEVSRQTAADEAEQHYKVALTYREMGMLDDAVRELELAARAPRLRFEAASQLARLIRDRGDVPSAIDWFERAAEAPAPTPEAGRALLYELGQALESCGEVARALAVYLELQADAGEYADLKPRIERLSRVQTES